MNSGSLLDLPASGRGMPPAGAVSVAEGVRRLACGEVVMLRADPGDPGRFDLVAAADRLTTIQTAFLVRHTSGFLQVALRDSRAETLQIPPVAPGADRLASQQCVGVDAAEGIGTGISAADRSRTIALLGSPATTRENLTRPGHVLPVRVAAHPRRHDSAAIALDLAERAGSIAAVFATVVSADPYASGLSDAEAARFAAEFGLTIISDSDLADVARLRTVTDSPARVPTPAMTTNP
ncbi:3,4-dihydroxy-2-butanone-4-phosphate synthase [Gordonia sp. NPDC127522]|uniref:3,4-dihydroxy-2-butanone-4-phosphate synthase n=1 Tax=Gordonia sp. NPDC127522 TaxID=3345390 RepID=UPI0036406AE1